MGTSKALRFYQVAVIILATYGILYFSYKFYLPSVAGTDFYQYYNMYLNPLDFDQAKAPFIYRQFSAVITNIIYELGIYYPNGISYSDPKYKQELFFSALFSNYIALLLTAIVVSSIVNLKTDGRLLLAPIVAGLLCFLSFFTQTTVLTGLSEGWSWFLVSIAFYGYITHRLIIIVPVLVLSIFQREMLIILFLVMAFTDWFLASKQYKRFYSLVTIIATLSFLMHLLVRTILLPAPSTGSGGQHLDVQSMLPNFIASLTPSKEAIFQSALSQNIYMIFLMTVLFFIYLQIKEKKPLRIVDTGIIQISLALIVISIISGLAAIGNNTGRVLSLATPIIAALTAIHFSKIEAMTGSLVSKESSVSLKK